MGYPWDQGDRHGWGIDLLASGNDAERIDLAARIGYDPALATFVAATCVIPCKVINLRAGHQAVDRAEVISAATASYKSGFISH
jgi:hypothetical protein